MKTTTAGVVGWGAALSALLLLPAACQDAAASSPLEHARSSPEALVESVLGALAAGDEESLESFLITREEYGTLLWPELPDGQYTPFEFVWSLAATNNRKGARQALSEYGGLGLELVSITFTGEPEEYQSFTLHPGVQVKVRRMDDGREGILPSFDVLVEYGGAWKLLNLDEL